MPVAAKGPDHDESADRATDAAVRSEARTQRDEIRLREDSARTEARATEDRARAETRATEDRTRAVEQASKVEARAQQDSAKAAGDAAKDAADAAARAAKDAGDAAKDAAKTNGDAAKDAAKLAEDAAKDAAKLADDAAKDAADAAKEQAKQAEDAAKNAADAAEDAAKAAADAAKDAADSSARADDSASASLHDLGASENPEFDHGGYPVRRGEVVALDISPATRARAEVLGFRVVGETSLKSLGSVVTRFAAPDGMTATDARDAMRALDANTHFDSAHYYGLLAGVAVPADGPAPQMAPRKPGALRVGMIDTGVAPHAALRGTAIEARDFSGGTGAVTADHGTAVASILAHEGTTRIVAANIFKASDGRPFTSPDAIARALEWMLERDVAVINISLAGPRNDILDTLIARVVARGHIVVAAAGNGGPAAPPAYPAAIPSVVAVTAVDSANRVYRYANQGDYIAFAAEGVAVPAAAAHGSIAAFSGTSFATPHVTAELARCLQKTGKAKGDQCVKSMQLAARDLGAPGRDPVYGYGLLD
jgi:hypothetical protein